MAGCIGIEESRKWGRRGSGKSGALRRPLSRRARISASSPRCLSSISPAAVAIICSAQVHCLTWDERKSGPTSAKESGRSKMSESRRGRERSDLKSATMPTMRLLLTGKEEVFAAVPEGLFTELLCAVTAAAEVKGMDLGLGIKAGCFRARRAERWRG